MKLNLASSAGVKARVMEYDEADVAALVAAGKIAEITVAINADRRQKVALVEFRAELSERIGNGRAATAELPAITGLGFAIKTTTVKKDNEDVTIPDETEGDHIKRFIAALVDGSFTHQSITISSGDAKAKEASAYVALQAIADQCGDEKTPDGLPCYTLNIDRPVRTGGGGNLLPKWALEAATKILAGPNVDAWVAKFTNGFTSPEGIVIDPIVFSPFNTPGTDEVTIAANKKNLARALVDYDKQKRAKTASEFA